MSDAAQALATLEEAVASGPRPDQPALRGALGRASQGDFAGAEALVRGAGPSAAAAGLQALLSELLGRPEEAASWLDRCVAAAPRRPWPYVLRALALRRRGRLDDARRDLDAAVGLSARPATLELRARLLSDLGCVVEAINDVDAVLAARGPDAALLSLRARFLLQRRNYPEAEAALDAAISLSPEDGGLLSERAQLFVLTDRPALARKDVEAALALAPQDEGLLLWRLRLLVDGARGAEAGVLIKRLGRLGPRLRSEARFYRGCLALRRGRALQAGKDFKAVMAQWPESDALSMRARLYWVASLAVEPSFLRRHGMKKSLDKKSAKLSLCGLGIFPPYTASLEVLHAISRCDVIFNNVAGGEVRSLLGEFCADIRPASYQAWQDEPKWADVIFKEIAKGRRVGFVTRGHPLVFGGLAVELVRRCKAQNLPHESFGAVSSIDHLLAYAGLGLGDDMQGVQVLDRPAVEKASAINTDLPLLACFYSGVEGRARVAGYRKRLQKFYPGSHKCWMFGPKYDTAPVVLTLAELDARYPDIHASLMLFVPPLKGARLGRLA